MWLRAVASFVEAKRLMAQAITSSLQLLKSVLQQKLLRKKSSLLLSTYSSSRTSIRQLLTTTVSRKVSPRLCSRKTCKTTSNGLDHLAVTAELSTATSALQALRSVVPLEEKRKRVEVVNLAVTHGSNTAAVLLAL